jgi:hypothetical protein
VAHFNIEPTNTHPDLQLRHIQAISSMSAEKRPAGEHLSASQLVKRPRPDANTRTVAVVGGNAKSGALIQAVRHP